MNEHNTQSIQNPLTTLQSSIDFNTNGNTNSSNKQQETMTINHLSTTKRIHHHGTTRYSHLGKILFLSVVALAQSIIVKAELLNGIEACQNRCFNLFECAKVGNGLCCEWDDNVGGQCILNI